MATKEVQEYYRSTIHSELRPELKLAIDLDSEGKTAIDCGCGAGSNIKHLLTAGYTVHAYDIEEESISLCRQLFGKNPKVHLYLNSFGNFQYPDSSLIVADASLFFCPENELDIFFQKIKKSLQPKGVFCGAFLGARDTMAKENYNTNDYWGDVLVLNESKIRNYFNGYDILKWQELEQDGVTPHGVPHHWHIYIVVAKLI